MSLQILDTDHVSLLLNGHPEVIHRINQINPEDIAITIVTVQEIFNGWVIRINNPAQAHRVVDLYTNLLTTVSFLKRVQVLNFSSEVQELHTQLIREIPPLSKKRLQKDVRIAAIVLSAKGLLVTRNQKDFSQIPGLRIESWV
jgi:tRNA(fMet)-specific endonuclease VapC